MANKKFWNIVKKFNSLMASAIQGPNCTDPNLCKGDCCSIEIDVPKVLAQEYIKRGYALESDFIRSDVFTFKLRFDEHTRKCFLFDPKLNGCNVHTTGIKPPQCWIYPTKFKAKDNSDIKCKKLGGWRIINSEKTKMAEDLLKYYNFLCQLEANKELKGVKSRIISSNIETKMRSIPPSHLGGFIDKWKGIDILSAEGISLQMKKFCSKFNHSCNHIKEKRFLDCTLICEKIADMLKSYIIKKLPNFVDCEGPDTEGKYPLYKLLNFSA